MYLAHRGYGWIALSLLFEVDRARILDGFRQGVGLHWLPPYSSELNLIEILWRKIKREWLSPKAYLGFEHLKAELQTILDRFGSKYQITFLLVITNQYIECLARVVSIRIRLDMPWVHPLKRYHRQP